MFILPTLRAVLRERPQRHLKFRVVVQEQKLDKWGKQRLTELLAPKKASSEEIGVCPRAFLCIIYFFGGQAGSSSELRPHVKVCCMEGGSDLLWMVC